MNIEFKDSFIYENGYCKTEFDKFVQVTLEKKLTMPIKPAYQKFEVYGDNMPGLNEMISAAKTIGSRKGRFITSGYSKMKKLWNRKIVEALISYNIYPVDKLFLNMIWIERNKKRDPDNIAGFIKFILDGLQSAKIIKNDGWSQIKGWNNTFEIGPRRGVKVRLIDAG